LGESGGVPIREAGEAETVLAQTSPAVFGTAGVDLTEKLHDPLDVRFGTRRNSGTNITKAAEGGRPGARRAPRRGSLEVTRTAAGSVGADG
jgi:hypothetical protein